MLLNETKMSHTVLLTIEIHDEATPKQKKEFCEELLSRDFEEVKASKTKWHVKFEDSYTERSVINKLKEDLEEITKRIGIQRYNVVVHFEKSSLVIFFSGKNKPGAK